MANGILICKHAAATTTEICVQGDNVRGNNELGSPSHPCLLLGNALSMHGVSSKIRNMNKFIVDCISNGKMCNI